MIEGKNSYVFSRKYEAPQYRASKATLRLHRLYTYWVYPHIRQPLNRQRLKLAWVIWGYWPLLFIKLSFSSRMRLLIRFIWIDFNVLHAHWPCEIAAVCRALAQRRARSDEVMIEAGRWQGGSSAKFSIMCKLLGYKLHIYDSFQGVEQMTTDEVKKSWDFSGQYAATETTVRSNLVRFGEADVCVLHKGWFAETLAVHPVPDPIRVVFIDCDLAKGTCEVLNGVMPQLVDDGWIFSQDFAFKGVREVLTDPETWKSFGKSYPRITPLGGYLASLKFE